MPHPDPDPEPALALLRAVHAVEEALKAAGTDPELAWSLAPHADELERCAPQLRALLAALRAG